MVREFYDQDNPDGYSRNGSKSDSPVEPKISDREVVFHEGNGESYVEVRRGRKSAEKRIEQSAEKLIGNSVGLPDIDYTFLDDEVELYEPKITKRMVAMAAAGLVAAGIAVYGLYSVVSGIFDWFDVIDATSDFNQTYIIPNTHRTSDLQHFYYDYEDIADAIQYDGVVSSTELYKAYRNLGQKQTNRVLECSAFNGDLQEFVQSIGYVSIDDWEKDEKDKIAKQADVERMVNESQVNDTNSDSYTGGKK